MEHNNPNSLTDLLTLQVDTFASALHPRGLYALLATGYFFFPMQSLMNQALSDESHDLSYGDHWTIRPLCLAKTFQG